MKRTCDVRAVSLTYDIQTEKETSIDCNEDSQLWCTETRTRCHNIIEKNSFHLQEIMPAPFHQIVAVIYVLRRLVICTSVAPLLIVCLPIALRLLYTGLSLCVGGDDRSILLVSAVTACFSGLALYCHSIIDMLSSEATGAKAISVNSNETQRSESEGTKEDNATERSEAATQGKSTQSAARIRKPTYRIQIQFWLAMFVLSLLIVRSWERSFLLRVVRNLLPSNAFLLQLPSISMSLRLSFSTLVLGCMVAARFFGPTSIGTLSPLIRDRSPFLSHTIVPFPLF
jgi:hypothetical protein